MQMSISGALSVGRRTVKCHRERGREMPNKAKVKACPECGEVPMIGYCCGEYFVFHPSKVVGTCICASFSEMHSSEQQEIDAWNRRVENYGKG